MRENHQEKKRKGGKRRKRAQRQRERMVKVKERIGRNQNALAIFMAELIYNYFFVGVVVIR